MAMRDVTAQLMGDPAARHARRPRPDEMEESRYAHLKPQGKRAAYARTCSELGTKVRAMEPGDVLVIESGKVAANFQSLMVRERGWTMTCRSKVLADGRRVVQLKRLT